MARNLLQTQSLNVVTVSQPVHNRRIVIDPKVSERVRDLRRRKHWRQADLAQAAGVATNTVGGLERGRQTRWPQFEKIAAAFGLTAVDVSRRLRGTSVDLAGGRAELGGRDQAIRTLAGAKTLNELAGTMIALPMGGTVRLDDLGIVTDTIADRRTFARLNSEPVVALGIKRSKGASDVVGTVAVFATRHVTPGVLEQTDVVGQRQQMIQGGRRARRDQARQSQARSAGAARAS